MAAKKKLHACHSQMTYRLPHCMKNSSHTDNNYDKYDYSETILHRLRPRIHRQKAPPRILRRLPVSLTHRKRTRPYVKRCSICRSKRFNRQNDRENLSPKTMRIVKPRVALLRTIESPEMDAEITHSGMWLNSALFIQSIRNYIASTFREGRRWATKYLFRALNFDKKSGTGVEDLMREGIRQTVGPSSPQINRVRQRNFRGGKDKTRKRCKSRNQDGDGSGCGTTVLSSSGFPAGNSPREVNPGDLPVSNEKQRRSCAANVFPVRRADDWSGNGRSERRKLFPPSCRIRRKRTGRNIRTGRCPGRYKKVLKKIRDRHPCPRLSHASISSKKLSEHVMNNFAENSGNNCDKFFDEKDNDREDRDDRNDFSEEKNDQKNVRIHSNESPSPEKDRMKLVNRDKFSETSIEDCDIKNVKIDVSRIRDGSCITSYVN